ncbi:isochorismatase family protein [Corallincola luteus]|uniref:isochorismatase n=1 Tax=Corallincola luteus TaxID=1775177 RepID=A0ABY2ALA1_9GAMM|nr:isochorismatase family protein [Corallincola luteus]TCI03699.1 isochorismatase family protein [Corallincola luteus]
MTIPAIQAYSLADATAPILNKVGWSVDPQRAVLLIHDMQQYFVNFYDQQQEPISRVIQHIGQIRAAAEAAGIPVVYTAQPGDQPVEHRALLSDFWGPGLKDDSALTQIVPALRPAANDTVLTKWRYSAFQRTELKKQMAQWQRDQLIIVGVYAHIGCMQTAAEAFMLDIQPFIVSDAVADFSLQEHLMSLNYIAGRCGKVITTETLQASISSQENSTYPIPGSRHTLLKQLADLLEIAPDEITADDSLLDFGLDSVRMMSLVGDWQQQGLNVSFIELAAVPCVESWWQLLSAKLEEAAA